MRGKNIWKGKNNMNKWKERAAGFYHYRHLLWRLVERDVKLKYRRSFLGYVWSILNPLMIMIIMVAVFSNIFRFSIENYPVYLIIGQTIFNFVSESTNQAMWSITGNAALLKKTYVPKYIFTLSKVTSSCVNTLFSLGAMLIVFVVCKVPFNRYIYAAFITAWMYLTPIFYPINQLPFELMWGIKHFNPMYSYITQFRTIVLYQTMPDPRLIVYGFAISFAVLVIGTASFMKNQDRFILYI